jgi:Tfp pilus assembly protein FimT
MVTVTIISISITLTAPSWERVRQKRSLTNVTEQVAAFLVVAQGEAQKRNLPVSLSFNRTGNDSWCLGAVVGAVGCDCMETDTSADQFCSIDGNRSIVEATSFQRLNLLQASDTQPAGGDSNITFDPVRGILQPNGDKLQFTFESDNGEFLLRLNVTPTGLLTICNPDTGKLVSGYATCAT